MPGGFARVGASPDTDGDRHAARRPGGRRLGRQPRRRSSAMTLLPAERRRLHAAARRGVLPSRAADNLFWLGRYVERAEGTGAHAARLSRRASPRPPTRDMPLLCRSSRLPRGHRHRRRRQAIPAGLIATLDSAVDSAGQIRDRFSPDGWLALTDLSKTVASIRGGGHAGRRRRAGDDGAPAQARRLLRPACTRTCTASPAGASSRSAAGWSAASRCRALTALFAKPGAADGAPRPAARDRRQRDDPPPPLPGQFGPAHRDRPAGARRQSALDPVPARRDEGGDRTPSRPGRRGAPPPGPARSAAASTASSRSGNRRTCRRNF